MLMAIIKLIDCAQDNGRFYFIFSFDKDFDILVHYVDKNYKIRLHRVLTKAYKGLISS